VTVTGPAPAASVELRVRQRMNVLAAAPPSRDGGAFNVLARMTARLANVTVASGLATLDYSTPSGDWGIDGSAMLRAFVQQVVYTASEEPGIASVLITQDGGQEAVIGGEDVHPLAHAQLHAGGRRGSGDRHRDRGREVTREEHGPAGRRHGR